MVADYYLEDHGSVTRLVKIALRRASGISVYACDEAVARPGLLKTRLQLGVRSISVAPPLVPFVEEPIRKTTLVDLSDG